MNLDEAIDLIQSDYDLAKRCSEEARDYGDFSYANKLKIKMADYYYFLSILKEIKDGLD